MAAALLTAAAYFAPSAAAARDHSARAVAADSRFSPARVAQMRAAVAAGRERDQVLQLDPHAPLPRRVAAFELDHQPALRCVRV